MRVRNTKQQEAILQVIQGADKPMTVHEVLAEGQKYLPTLGLATVYREMNRLCEAQEVVTVIIPGDLPRYEVAKGHHHHFKCTQCNSVFELEGCLKDLKQLVPRGFKIRAHDLTFYGSCRVCMAAAD